MAAIPDVVYVLTKTPRAWRLRLIRFIAKLLRLEVVCMEYRPQTSGKYYSNVGEVRTKQL